MDSQADYPLALRVCSQQFASPQPAFSQNTLPLPLCSENVFPLPLCSHRHSAFTAAHALISDALLRCSGSREPTRITVSFSKMDCLSSSQYQAFKFEVADTGRGVAVSMLGDFYPYYLHPCFHSLSAGTATDNVFWDGVFSVITTAAGEQNMRSYQMQVEANLMPQVMQLQPVAKAVRTMSGTQSSMTFKGQYEEFFKYVQQLILKVSLLNTKNLFLELCFENFDSFRTHIQSGPEFLVCDGGLRLPETMSSLQRLSTGLVDYLIEHVYQFSQQAEASYFRTMVNVGEGRSCADRGKTVTDVCFSVLEKDPAFSVASTEAPAMTQVLFYEDFCYHHIPEALLDTLRNKIAWKRFGLKIQSIHIKQCGGAVISWEELPRHVDTYLVIHTYRDYTVPRRTKTKRETTMFKRALEQALEKVKKACPSLFVAEQIKEMKRLAPDLSRCLAGLISSSSNHAFREECANVLGLAAPDPQSLEFCIRDKLLKVIDPDGVHNVDEGVSCVNWMRSVPDPVLDSQTSTDSQPSSTDSQPTYVFDMEVEE